MGHSAAYHDRAVGLNASGKPEIYSYLYSISVRPVLVRTTSFLESSPFLPSSRCYGDWFAPYSRLKWCFASKLAEFVPAWLVRRLVAER